MDRSYFCPKVSYSEMLKVAGKNVPLFVAIADEPKMASFHL